jgi:hypothetical protein
MFRRSVWIGLSVMVAAFGGWIASERLGEDRGAQTPYDLRAQLTSRQHPGTGLSVTTVELDDIISSGGRPLVPFVGGRVVGLRTRFGRPEPEGSGAVRETVEVSGFMHQWPGVYAIARFRGDALVAAFDDRLNQYRIVFENGTTQVISRPGRQALRFDGLGPGDHVVRLEKMSESQDGVGTVIGFFVPAEGGVLAPPRPGSRQIEFIGNSDMVGYGNTSATRDCTGEEVFLLTDTQQAYPSRVAQHFGADYQVIAYSGIGVTRNYAGAKPDINMRRLYPRTLFNDPAPYRRDGWKPQVIVVALGANDFVPEVGANERWADQGALRLDFEAAYEGFLRDMRAQNPSALILVAMLQRFEPTYTAAHRTVVAAVTARGDSHIQLFTYPKLENTGCHWHPSLTDHQRIAKMLIDYMDAQPSLWPGD